MRFAPALPRAPPLATHRSLFKRARDACTRAIIHVLRATGRGSNFKSTARCIRTPGHKVTLQMLQIINSTGAVLFFFIK